MQRVVEAGDAIVEAFGFMFKEECLEEKRVKSCALGNRHSWILKMQKVNKKGNIKKNKQIVHSGIHVR